MMAKKMAGFFSVLGVLVFLANWLYFCFLPEKGEIQPMTAEKAWEIGIYLAAAFFLLGLFVATLGIALVQEVLAESRSRDMERKFRAKTTYDRIVNMDMAVSDAVRGEESATAPAAPGA
ncbi:MAG: hypothetical protein LIQ31_05245 [Planctomycetes bacterium]|nr:hypothetical protein [Planctomycetota bacterium]